MNDTAKTATRRNREKTTISHMVALFCDGHHKNALRVERSYCGKLVCSKCLSLDTYAVEKTEQCRNMGKKTSCEACENHCYQPAKREQIRTIMRYSGPRMIIKHPLAALRHLLNK